MMQHIPFASLVATPWKNGGGSTTPIALSPPQAGLDDFDWRVSLATLAVSGPFSVFPGVDRTLALVEGPGAVLEIDGARRVHLSAADPVCRFAGESAVTATVGERPSTDFNVMTRRTRCRHQLELRELSGRSVFVPGGDLTLVFLVEGEGVRVERDGEQVSLARFDAVLFERGSEVTLEAVKGRMEVPYTGKRATFSRGEKGRMYFPLSRLRERVPTSWHSGGVRALLRRLSLNNA